MASQKYTVLNYLSGKGDSSLYIDGGKYRELCRDDNKQ